MERSMTGRTRQSDRIDQIPFAEATFKALVQDFDLPFVYPATLSTMVTSLRPYQIQKSTRGRSNLWVCLLDSLRTY